MILSFRQQYVILVEVIHNGLSLVGQKQECKLGLSHFCRFPLKGARGPGGVAAEVGEVQGPRPGRNLLL